MIIHYSSRVERRRDLASPCSLNTLCTALQVPLSPTLSTGPLVLVLVLCTLEMYQPLLSQHSLHSSPGTSFTNPVHWSPCTCTCTLHTGNVSALALSTLFAQLSRYIPLSLSCQRVHQPTLHTGIGNINIALSTLLNLPI